MPTYVYRVKSLPESDPSAFFEVRQSMSDPALERHPETGEAVERVICAPALLGGASAPAASAAPSGGHRHGPSCGCGH
jgi:predicted nucleic acid-binding Zn ribbon protein